jgi:hypothetical protein
MLGSKPGRFWIYCWRYISPLFLIVIFISAIARTRKLQLQSYVYPEWSNALGWAITCSSMFCVPLYILYAFCRANGSFREVTKALLSFTLCLPVVVCRQPWSHFLITFCSSLIGTIDSKVNRLKTSKVELGRFSVHFTPMSVH